MPPTFDGSACPILWSSGWPRSKDATRHVLKAQKLLKLDAPESRQARKASVAAVKEFSLAMSFGCVTAAQQLAEVYWNGSVPGFTVDFEKAGDLYIFIMEHPLDVVHEMSDEVMCYVLHNFEQTASDSLEPTEAIMARLEAVAAHPEWRRGTDLGRRVRMTAFHVLGCFAWKNTDRVYALRCLHKAAEQEKKTSISTGATQIDQMMQVLCLSSNSLLEKIRSSNEYLSAAAQAAQAGNMDEAGRIMREQSVSNSLLAAEQDAAEDEIRRKVSEYDNVSASNPGGENKCSRVCLGISTSSTGSVSLHSHSVAAASSFPSERAGVRPKKHGLASGVCSGCKKPAFEVRKLLSCPCKSAFYCSDNRACQLDHWKAHKTEHHAAMTALVE